MDDKEKALYPAIKKTVEEYMMQAQIMCRLAAKVNLEAQQKETVTRKQHWILDLRVTKLVLVAMGRTEKEAEEETWKALTEEQKKDLKEIMMGEEFKEMLNWPMGEE